MGIIKEIFGKVRIYQLRSRVDSRGFMSYVFDDNIYDFSIKEARIYSMPKEGTFFGIHYKEESSPMTKLVTVIKGKGMDYVIDLRKGSPTYLQWESIELSEENALAVQIPGRIWSCIYFIAKRYDTVIRSRQKRSRCSF